MIPGAQLCDVCEGQLLQDPPTVPNRFPDHLLPAYESTPTETSVTCLRDGQQRITDAGTVISSPHHVNHEYNHPAPLATFGNHFAAAQASAKYVSAKPTDQHLQQIHAAVQTLANCCVHCWSHGLEYSAHRLAECPFYADELRKLWKTWKRHVRLPVGCCFFCGCPLNVGQVLTFLPIATNKSRW